MEQKIKQRLVGAIVLVALMVVVLPLVFDGQGLQRLPDTLFSMPDSQLGKVRPPDKPSFPDKIDGTLRQATVRSLMPDASAGSGKTPEETPIERSEGKAAPVKAPPPTVRPPDPRPWRVQLASFRNKAPAKRLVRQLEDQGHQAVVRSERNTGRRVWYVVVLVTHGTYDEVQQLTERLSKRYSDIGKPIIRRGGP